MDRENRESMEEIHLRILRVTDDLRVIQRELNCAAMQAPSDPELMEALADPPEMESVQSLKSGNNSQQRVWVAAHWKQTPNGQIWIEGYWKRIS